MSTRVGFNHVEVIRPLLPVTGAFLAPFTAYFALLSARVVYQRVHEKVFFGEDSPSPKPAPIDISGKSTTSSKKKHPTHTSPTPEQRQDFSPLTVATRSHANFVEHVPFALVLAAAAELNGGSRRALTAALGVLLAARVLHVEFGLRRPGATGMGRAVGWWGTMGAMGWLAGYGGWLVRGQWGWGVKG